MLSTLPGQEKGRLLFFLKQHSSGPQKAHREEGNEGDRQGISKLQHDVLRKNEAETSNQTGMLASER